jgi:hypothetical protein
MREKFLAMMSMRESNRDDEMDRIQRQFNYSKDKVASLVPIEKRHDFERDPNAKKRGGIEILPDALPLMAAKIKEILTSLIGDLESSQVPVIKMAVVRIKRVGFASDPLAWVVKSASNSHLVSFPERSFPISLRTSKEYRLSLNIRNEWKVVDGTELNSDILDLLRLKDCGCVLAVKEVYSGWSPTAVMCDRQHNACNSLAKKSLVWFLGNVKGQAGFDLRPPGDFDETDVDVNVGAELMEEDDEEEMEEALKPTEETAKEFGDTED